jgi:hypothetical protein
MEPRFGHDFSRVRVHSDDKAAKSARAINTAAYTIGQDIVFSAGHYTPGTVAGRRLLAHELAHVVQQGGQAKHFSDVTLDNPDASYEAEADKIAEASMLNRAAPVAPHLRTGVLVQRQGFGELRVAEARMEEELRRAANKFPFGLESQALMRDYVDNRVTAVAVNLMTGLVYITVENAEQPIEVPLSEFQEGAVDLYPSFPQQSH